MIKWLANVLPSCWQKRSALLFLLFPLVLIWQIIFRLRWFFLHDLKKKPARKIPLWCFGNVVVGGSGKTPALIAVAELLKELSFSVACISKGYGRKNSLLEALQVDPEKHSAGEVGDEPLLLARHLPVFVCDKREIAYQAACDLGVDLVLADDGLQDPHLFPTDAFLIFDGNGGVGNGWLLPAGPMREPLASALKKISAVFRMCSADKNSVTLETGSKPMFDAVRSVSFSAHDTKKFIAFAGIAKPNAFFDALPQERLLQRMAFPDHYFYQEDDLLELEKLAQKNDALLVTTEKDFVRLPKKWRYKVTIVSLHIEWKNKNSLLKFLREKLVMERA